MSAGFHTTRWTLVLAAVQPDDASARRALGELCQVYRGPLLAHAKRRGLNAIDAEDAVQGFYERLLRLESLGAARQERGRFRSFLLGSFNHYLADRRDYERAAKRGGGMVASVDSAEFAIEDFAAETPDAAFDKAWALALLDAVLARLQGELADAGKAAWFEALSPLLGGKDDAVSQAKLAVQLGLSETAFRVALHRLRKRYKELLRAEVAETLAKPEQVDDELRHLIAALRG
ncbi:RNA polymerase sigma factor [Cerasicoccus maritimus]|uniref:RNA polymerase sigma factor n=1 Tax=Cerasicoccus maritimus TaxID=490089 RepID=UPI00285288E0|nr:hypothetical protein [Cerasicoccus maritimus]